jgi:NADH:ubiquinone oxidoreductase subunit B-like Fe-S oxidoreductase
MLPPSLLEGERKSCAVWYVIFRQSPEIRAVNNPFIDQEQVELHFVASPRHADALLCTGPFSCHRETALRGTWLTTPAPRAVIPSGDCACAGGELGVSAARCGRVEHVIPVDLCIPGCLLDAGRLDSRTGGGSGATGGRNRAKTQKGYQ